jgi:hypothetical protein
MKAKRLFLLKLKALLIYAALIILLAAAVFTSMVLLGCFFGCCILAGVCDVAVEKIGR